MQFYPSTGGWSTTLHLAPGCYHYKLVVDEAWVLAPGQEQEQDTLGNTNSVLIVEEKDEEVKDDGKIAEEKEVVLKEMKENEEDTVEGKEEGKEVDNTEIEKLERQVKKTGLERLVEKETYRKPSEGNDSFVLKLNDTLDYEELNKRDETPVKTEKVENEMQVANTDENNKENEPKARGESDLVRQDLESFKNNFKMVTSPIETKQKTSAGINEETMNMWGKVVIDVVKRVATREESREITPELSDVVSTMNDLNIKTDYSKGKKKVQTRKKTIDIESDDDLVGPGPPAMVVEKAFMVQAEVRAEVPRAVKVKGEARERPRRVTRAATKANYSAGAS